MNFRKIIAVLAAVLMLCSIIPMGAMVSAAAAIVNSDFEDGTVGSWTTSSGTALAIVAAADLPVANPNGGNYALYFESTNYSYVNYKMTVKANTTYKISLITKQNISVSLVVQVNTVTLRLSLNPTKPARAMNLLTLLPAVAFLRNTSPLLTPVLRAHSKLVFLQDILLLTLR